MISKWKRRDIGIYKFTFPNGMIYVGQCNSNFAKKLSLYKSRGDNPKYHKGKGKLFAAIGEFGMDNIKVVFMNYPAEMLDWAEAWHIRQYDSRNNGYNSQEGGRKGYTNKQTDEVKEHLRKTNIGRPMTQEAKDKISRARKGMKFSKSHVENMRKANLGKKLTQATKDKLSESMKEYHKEKHND